MPYGWVTVDGDIFLYASIRPRYHRHVSVRIGVLMVMSMR
jgi:hypothetical protein